MKIAIFTRAYITQVSGGIPSVCSSLAEGLVRKGHEVHVITTGHTLKEENKAGVNIHYTDSQALKYTPRWDAKAFKTYRDLGPFDIAYSESGAASAFIKEIKEPTFARLHGVSFEEMINHFYLVYVQGRPLNDADHLEIRKQYEQYFRDIEILKRYDHLIAISKEATRVLKYRFFHPSVFTVWNGIDTEIFYDRRAERKLRFLSVGKNDVRKGHKLVAEAIKIAQQTYPEIELLVVHDKTREELVDLYQTSWAFIDGSIHYTGMNTTRMEAMACGLPVISWDIENFREMFEGTSHSQLCSPLGDVQGMARNIVELCDKTQWEIYSGCAIGTSNRFISDRNIEAHIKIFKEVMRGEARIGA